MPSNPEERVALPGRIAALAEQYAESWSQMLGAETLWSDVNAGVAVALVALPLSIAIAIASGVHPGAGLTSAILAGAIAALMGGSRVAVTGPAAAVSVVALGVVQTYGLEGLLACGLFTGAVQCMVGLLRWGRWISIVPLPVIVGFTSGIGVLIVDGQLPMALGAVVKRGHEGMYVPFTWLSSHWGSFQAGAATITFVTLATLILARRFNPRLPGHLLGAIAGTFAAETLFPACSRVGDLPRSLAYHGMPHLGLSQLGGLVVPACTIAFLASLESLLSALVADSMTRDRHDPDLELIGQGLANIIAPLFGGIVSTGVIARTAVSVQAGARTRMAALVHSGFLLLLMLLAAPLAGRVPQASLAAILVYSGIKMIEWHQFARVMQVSRLEAAIIAITTAVIVATDLAVGFQVGLLFSFVLAAMKLGQVHVGSPRELAPRLERCPAHAQLVVRSVEGPMFFASFQGLSAQLQLTKAVRYLVVDLSRVTYVDVTAAEGLIELKAGLARKGQSLLLSAPTPEVVAILARAELIQHGGEPWIFGSLEESFAWAHLHRLASPQPAARRKTVRLVHEPAPAV